MIKSRFILFISLCLSLILFVSCKKEYNDLYVVSQFNIDAGDTINVNNINVALTLTNINTNEEINVTQQTTGLLQIRCLKGIYRAFAQGTIRYTNGAGETKIRRFRFQSDYLELLKRNQPINKLQIFFID